MMSSRAHVALSSQTQDRNETSQGYVRPKLLRLILLQFLTREFPIEKLYIEW